MKRVVLPFPSENEFSSSVQPAVRSSETISIIFITGGHLVEMMRVPDIRSVTIREFNVTPSAVFDVISLVTSHLLSVLELMPTQFRVGDPPGTLLADISLTVWISEEIQIETWGSASSVFN
jgi:hypothetical protein